MQFEEFDNKIREAADHHHPAYDENAWARMEKLLNKHLPQENDGRKRRIIFFLFLFLLLGGGSAWLLSTQPWRGNKQVASSKTTIQKPPEINSTPISSASENPGEDNSNLNKKEIPGQNEISNDKITTNPSTPDQTNAFLNPGIKKDRLIKNPSGVVFNNKKNKTEQPILSFTNSQGKVSKNVKKELINKTQPDAVATNTNVASIIPDQKNNGKDVVSDKDLTTIASNTKPVINAPATDEKTNKNYASTVQSTPEKKSKVKSKKGNTFFFTLSAGPDVSATGGDKLGKAKLLAGVGLGYTFKDRLTIRSGFYTGRKIYTSSPESYHPPGSFWNYYPNLQKVDADCRVYEIPLSLSYNFSHSSKHQLFASAGISSLLMKKETYNYFYKYSASGPTVTKKYTIRDQNKHYFSILTLSGGYQKNIGKSFSIVVEPYFKIPLSGVGFGKVKLNSGGILFSAVIKPFAGSGKQSTIKH